MAICRQKCGIAVPEVLQAAYASAVSALASLVAAAKGFHSVAEAALELSPAVAADFLEWFSNR